MQRSPRTSYKSPPRRRIRMKLVPRASNRRDPKDLHKIDDSRNFIFGIIQEKAIHSMSILPTTKDSERQDSRLRLSNSPQKYKKTGGPLISVPQFNTPNPRQSKTRYFDKSEKKPKPLKSSGSEGSLRIRGPILKDIVKKYLNPNIGDSQSRPQRMENSIVARLANGGNWGAIIMLISKNQNFGEKIAENGDTILHIAARDSKNADFEVFRRLLELGLHKFLLQSNIVGETPISIADKLGRKAIWNNMLETVKYITQYNRF